MLGAFNWLDIAICIALLSFFIAGIRRGFLLTVGDMLGLIAGGIAAFFAIPLVSTWVSNPWGRVGLMVGVAAVLILLGQALGRVIATWIKRRLNFDVVRVFDRLMGGALSVLITATVIGALAFSTSSMGIPRLSTEIANSKMIEAIRGATPQFVTSAISSARSAVMAQTLPAILEPFAPTVEPVEEGDWEPTEAQLASERSVAKISGTAVQCGVNLSGSGFVVADQMVMTNAHVVAGLSAATVELPEEGLLRGKVVYFDPAADIAVLYVEGMQTPSLSLAPQDLERGDAAAFSGHPSGGPLQTRGAVVASQATVSIANIYGEDPGSLSVYQLTAEVMQGNSGGPLLDDAGQAVGMIFAKSRSDEEIGFALSLDEVERAMDQADGRTTSIKTGECID
ncbi:MarP family serine protease [Glutamicibacter sp. MNS18]|uniref:MarP family serine protease n=1 Tax=Glutamicibacter sp. MNS18 TaxID=2989817 RepID=UPI002236416C|nr:MarP family serine protease [Glutamicibacter sp. MNS18]MCW4464000.1 MarP family serine protease [Glutamicibacter sp. MNS18]